jgi:hypothetical protein
MAFFKVFKSFIMLRYLPNDCSRQGDILCTNNLNFFRSIFPTEIQPYEGKGKIPILTNFDF